MTDISNVTPEQRRFIEDETIRRVREYILEEATHIFHRENHTRARETTKHLPKDPKLAAHLMAATFLLEGDEWRAFDKEKADKEGWDAFYARRRGQKNEE